LNEGAHTPGERPPVDPADVLSGASGIVTGRRGRLAGALNDAADEAAAWLRLVPPRLARAAARAPVAGPVHVAGIYSPGHAGSMARAVAELRRSRRRVTFALGALGEADAALAPETALSGLRGRGKFENLNALLERTSRADAQWLVVIDDDVSLPRGFLDRFLFVCERLGLQLAQPALTHASHGAWPVFRRARWSIARATRMVEIGPLTAFAAPVAEQLVPFPPLRMGWGLDSHWGALALERGWRLGVVDATPIRHTSRVTASGYDREEALSELQSFLADRPYLDRKTANSVIQAHRGW
jgi:hypothetical protein